MQRHLAAILCADVVGYSRLMGDDEEATVETLAAYREVFTERIDAQHGRVLDAKGDALLAEFHSVVEAVSAAAAIQREIARRNVELPETRRMRFRIGINLGDVLERDDTIYGDGVNIAARLESIAEPGGICLSRAAYDQVKGKLPFEYEYLGEHQVKNIAEPVRVYRVLPPGGEAPAAQPQPSQSTKAESPATTPEKPSIAVLPFVNMSRDPDQEYFADGITEDLITDLSKLRGLHVTARNSTFVYKGRSVALRQVGRELGVRHVLEGSVRRSGNRLRITAQLIDTQSDDHLWAERYDRELKDVFDLQDEITQAIVTELDVKLLEGESARAWRRTTTDHRTYDLFLRGLSERRKFSKEAIFRARELFQQALELDPEFAAAMTFIGITYHMDAVGFWYESPEDSWDEALRWADRALAVDERFATAHSLAGMVRLFRGEHDLAISSLEKGASLEPTGRSFMYLAGGLCCVGRAEEGLDLARKAMESEPFPAPWFYTELGSAYRCLGRLDEAIETLRDAVTRAPYIMNHIHLALAFAATGRLEEAQTHATEVLRIGPHFSRDLFFNMFKNPDERARLIALAKEAGLP
ncbi:MAG: hypothetical protein IIA41_03125 [SAR324 cluster bacterium]|nr:hypothetical protein [SAR324 cluster bacterium]